MISPTRENGRTTLRNAASCWSVKPPGSLRGQACDMDGAVGVEQRQRQIVGAAFLAHVVEEGKAMAVGIVHAVAQLARGPLHDHYGAVEVFRRLKNVEIGGVDHDVSAPPPDEGAPVSVGMQRRHEGGGAPQRDAAIDQALAGLLQEGGRRRRRARAVHQPVEQVLQLCVSMPRISGRDFGGVKPPPARRRAAAKQNSIS